MLVGRARFELATNGLKVLHIPFGLKRIIPQPSVNPLKTQHSLVNQGEGAKSIRLLFEAFQNPHYNKVTRSNGN